mgnify:CR=1 FL=1
MQQLELSPELTTTESYIGVEFTDGEDVYVSAPALYGCDNCALLFKDESCDKSDKQVDCMTHTIIWVKKG